MFYESENRPFEVPHGRIKTYDEKISTWCSKVVCFKENDISCVFCSLSSAFYFIGDKIAVDHHVKDEITPLLKTNDGLKISQDFALNNLIEKGKSR